MGWTLGGCALWALSAAFSLQDPCLRDDGYRGLWYANQPSGDEYGYKYSGGFATYPQQHVPIACYSPEARKTFFCYGGRPRDTNRLLHMVSYYDHATGRVPRPAVLLDKKTDDAHDNPSLALDASGHLWIFSNAHGTSRPSYIHRSARPYSVDAFERVLETNFSYGQPWYLPGKGFLFLHTRYSPGRHLFWSTSPDGKTWSDPLPLARVASGHYQISASDGRRVATAFNYHPLPGGLNARTNLYYLETRDAGRTWTDAAGRSVALPLTEPRNAALVRDYQSEKLLVYLKDLAFDRRGRPVVLYLTSRGYASGPANDPRTWRTARWTGESWEFRDVTTSDHNYDFGSLYLEEDGTWRLIATTDPAAQRYVTGGEVVLWTSADEGRTWTKVRALTARSARNHAYPRRPLNAHPEFYALWADGDALRPSESFLYFADREGARVRRLPPLMDSETAVPETLW
ncbi:MAG TPA: BNR-4 repeat-containing protein [Planctomycetota bacterium]|nr:BNR-4 repeat-containing protein [Planctomycetota bacterium]